jgi:hypothetical protein
VHTHLNDKATLLVVEWWTPTHGLRAVEREWALIVRSLAGGGAVRDQRHLSPRQRTTSAQRRERRFILRGRAILQVIAACTGSR